MRAQQTIDNWTTTIEPRTALWDIPLRELWQYRGLIWMLVRRTYEVQYKQTILGFWWMILGQICASGIFSFVFGYVGKFSSDGIPYFLFYMSASVLWNLFNICVTRNTSVFMDNSYLFGKVYFPRLVVPMANVVFGIIQFALQFGLLAVVWLCYYIRGQVPFMGPYLLLMPPLVIVMAMMGMSVGLIISSLTVKYRDLSHLVTVGLQIMMYGSPVMYPVSQIPEAFRPWILLNPISSLVEAFRYAATGSGVIRWGYVGYSLTAACIMLIISLVMFNQTEKTFIDII